MKQKTIEYYNYLDEMFVAHVIKDNKYWITTTSPRIEFKGDVSKLKKIKSIKYFQLINEYYRQHKDVWMYKGELYSNDSNFIDVNDERLKLLSIVSRANIIGNISKYLPDHITYNLCYYKGNIYYFYIVNPIKQQVMLSPVNSLSKIPRKITRIQNIAPVIRLKDNTLI